MPIDYPDEPPPPVAVCEWDPTARVELQPTGDLDPDDLDEDPMVPEGWVRIVASRVVRNPDYDAETQLMREAIAAQTAQMKKAGATQEQAREARRMAKMELEERRDAPKFLVQIVEGVYSPEHAAKLQEVAGLPAWPSAER